MSLVIPYFISQSIGEGMHTLKISMIPNRA